MILVHQTATTASSPSLDETPSFKQHGTATVSDLQQKNHTTTLKIQEVETKNSKDLKPSSRQTSLASTIYAYFGKLLHGKKSKEFRSGSASDTAKNLQQSSWWRRFKSTTRRSKGQEKKRNQKFLWCFRPVGVAAAALEKKQNPLFWTTFEKRNQLELTEQFEKIRTVNRTNDCYELYDKKINGGKVVVTVMLKEGIAFVLDPEWSEPMTFEITQLPKLTLYQRLRARHDYKRWYKKQQQYLYRQNRPI